MVYNVQQCLASNLSYRQSFALAVLRENVTKNW